MIEVSIKDFSKAARIAAAVTDKWTTVPILSALKVRANGKMELEATNLDMTARVVIPCRAGKLSKFMVPDPRSLISAIGAAGGDIASFEELPAKDGKCSLRICAGHLTRSTEHRMQVDDWPQNQAQIGEQLFSATLAPDVLRQIERIAAAISKEGVRYYLNGINLKHLDGWTYRFAAADGHRLMTIDVPLPDATGILSDDIILPREFVTTIFNHFRKADGPIVMEIGSGVARNAVDATAPPPTDLSRVSFAARVGNADVHFAAKAIDGKYPDYSRVIPADAASQVLVDASELRRAILAVTGGQQHPLPAVRLSFKAGHMIVGLAAGVEGVSAEYQIECQHNAKDGAHVGFRAAYVLDMLNAVSGSEVRFGFSDEAGPCLIHDVSDPNFCGVLMPMRV